MSAGLLCGVDVGASKSDCVVCTAGGELLARVVGEPGAIQRYGPEHVAPIRKIVEKTCTTVGVDPSRLKVISVGLAGADSPELTERACSALAADFPSTRIAVLSDAAIALEAATSDRPAGVLIAGTGSIAYGEKGSETHRVGGWGLLDPDEGSGLEMTRQACAVVLQSVDGRGRDSALGDQLMEHFELAQPVDVVGLSRDLHLDPGRLATFVPRLFATAREGDAAAIAIVDRAVHQLRKLAAALVERLSDSGELLLLALAGGLFRDESFAAAVRTVLQIDRPGLTIVRAQLDPVFGAVLGELRSTRNADDISGVRERFSAALALA
jgi:N-acetylglucosamine kinase-like BadF-type ATPase